MWQLGRNSILTRDNLKKRNWLGNPTCSFCNSMETAQHLFFWCSMAKAVWGIVGHVIGAASCPSSLWQSLTWLYSFLSGGHKFCMNCIAAICWGIWTERNKITFEKHVCGQIPYNCCFYNLLFLDVLVRPFESCRQGGSSQWRQALMTEASKLAALMSPATSLNDLPHAS